MVKSGSWQQTRGKPSQATQPSFSPLLVSGPDSLIDGREPMAVAVIVIGSWGHGDGRRKRTS